MLIDSGSQLLFRILPQTYQRLFYASNPRKALQWRAQQNEGIAEDATKVLFLLLVLFEFLFKFMNT